MAIPQSILDSLAVVDNDETAVDSATQTSSASKTALAAATEQAANDEHAVFQAKTKLTADKQAFFALIQSTYKGDGNG